MVGNTAVLGMIITLVSLIGAVTIAVLVIYALILSIKALRKYLASPAKSRPTRP
jgi:hypothetical protein